MFGWWCARLFAELCASLLACFLCLFVGSCVVRVCVCPFLICVVGRVGCLFVRVGFVVCLIHRVCV